MIGSSNTSDDARAINNSSTMDGRAKKNNHTERHGARGRERYSSIHSLHNVLHESKNTQTRATVVSAVDDTLQADVRFVQKQD